jgi:hypothetical protein
MLKVVIHLLDPLFAQKNLLDPLVLIKNGEADVRTPGFERSTRAHAHIRILYPGYAPRQPTSFRLCHALIPRITPIPCRGTIPRCVPCSDPILTSHLLSNIASTYCCNKCSIQLKHIYIYIHCNICNILLKHVYIVVATCVTFRSTFQHTAETAETFGTYTCNIRI